MVIREFFTKYGQLIKNHPYKSWAILYCIWLMDLFSTILAVGMHPNAFLEANPLAAWFFNLGVYGWFIWAGCCGALIWMLLRFPTWSMNFNLLFKKKKKDVKRIKYTFNIAQVSFFCLLIMSEGFVIIHNFYLLSLHLFA